MRRAICTAAVLVFAAFIARPICAQESRRDRDEGRRDEGRRDRDRDDDRRDEGRRDRGEGRRDERRGGGDFGGRFGGGGPFGGPFGGPYGGQFPGGEWGGSRSFDPNMRGQGRDERRGDDRRGDDRRGDDGDRRRDRDRDSSSSSSSARKIIVNPNPGVPGFGNGADGKGTTVAGFGAASGVAGAAVAAVDERVRRMAESMLRQYDENKNGVLERDEWSKMRGDPEKADTNSDGRVTLDELSVRMASYSQPGNNPWGGGGNPWGGGGGPGGGMAGGPGGGRGEGGGGGRGGRGDWGGGGGEFGGGGEWGAPSTSGSPSVKKTSSSTTSSSNKAKRFLTPAERLPEGLPKWFAASDADGDGQVVMAEYATNWTDSKVSEFARYDINADGVLTPTECLTADKKKK